MGKGRTHRGTKEHRIEFAYLLLCRGHQPFYIKRALQRAFRVAGSGADAILGQAREMLLKEDLDRTVPQYKAESIQFYLHIAVTDKDGANRIRARREADRLLGIVQPDVNLHLHAQQQQQAQLQAGLTPDQKFELQKSAQVHRLFGRFTMMQIEKAKAYGVELHPDLQALEASIEQVRNVTPADKAAAKKGKRK